MKKIYVTQSSLPPFQEYVEEIADIWHTYRLTNKGEKYNKLEIQLKDYLKVENISLFVNGHMALELALQSFHLKGEVITTPFTFVSTTHAIVRNGLKPVFCDINIEDLTIDVNKMEQLITDRTVAIVPVHVYGKICDVDAIKKIAEKYNLKVIYDAAHAFGIKKDGNSVLNFGDASILSFHATKTFHTIEGGAVVYKDQEIGKELARLKNFGFQSEIEVDGVGANAKLDEFRAAMGLCNLRHIDMYIEQRKNVYNRYEELLGGCEGITFLTAQPGVESNYSYCPVIFDENVLGVTRDEIYEYLKLNDIYSRRYFYPLITDYSCYREKYNSAVTPVAKYVSDRILCLPIYPELEMDDIQRITSLILECISKNR